MDTAISRPEENFRKFVASLNQSVGLKGLCELYEEDGSLFIDILSKKDFSAQKAFKILDKSGLTYQDLGQDKCHEKALNYLNQRQYEYIPKEYLKAAYSSRSITNRILNILCIDFGEAFVTQMLNFLQVSPSAFSDMNAHKMINTDFNQKIYEYLVDVKGLKVDYLFTLGRKAAWKLQESDLAREMKKQKEDEVFDFFLDEVSKSFENSFHYKITSKKRGETKLKVDLNEKILSEIKCPTYSGLYTSIYSLGFAAEMAQYRFQKPIRAKIEKSIFNGDSETIFSFC